MEPAFVGRRRGLAPVPGLSDTEFDSQFRRLLAGAGLDTKLYSVHSLDGAGQPLPNQWASRLILFGQWVTGAVMPTAVMLTPHIKDGQLQIAWRKPCLEVLFRLLYSFNQCVYVYGYCI